MRARIAPLAGLLMLVLAGPLWAGARHTVLMDVLRVDELAALLRSEGAAFGATLDRDWLDGQGGAIWAQQVGRIHDPTRIAEGIRAGLEPALSGEALENVIAFYASDLGQRILTLENSARRAMADEAVEAAARDRFAAEQDEDAARVTQITRIIAAGDLVQRNVTTALNSNVAFLRALVDGDFYTMTEEEILSDVQSERAAIEQDTTTWMGGFMLLAYSPLTLDELKIYADFSETRAGRSLNAGFFAGFDPLYVEISYALGQALVRNMAAEEL